MPTDFIRVQSADFAWQSEITPRCCAIRAFNQAICLATIIGFSDHLHVTAFFDSAPESDTHDALVVCKAYFDQN